MDISKNGLFVVIELTFTFTKGEINVKVDAYFDFFTLTFHFLDHGKLLHPWGWGMDGCRA